VDLLRPLSPKEIDELGEFLNSDATPDESMNIAELDGFLTGLVISPCLVPPEIWMPAALGYDTEPDFDSKAQARWVLTRIARLMNSISMGFGEDPPRCEPLIYSEDPDGTMTCIAEDWCAGFMAAVALGVDDWEPLFNDRQNNLTLAPVATLGTEEGRRELDAAADPDDEYHYLVEMLQPSVIAIDIYWRMRERKAKSASSRPRPRGARPGRNAVCPCGSGRKLKKCCAAQTAS
jgi:uncharacterized protein